jgi:hypothetical protein
METLMTVGVADTSLPNTPATSGLIDYVTISPCASDGIHLKKGNDDRACEPTKSRRREPRPEALREAEGLLERMHETRFFALMLQLIEGVSSSSLILPGFSNDRPTGCATRVKQAIRKTTC